ncbi:MAG: sigma-54 dependent transcriptional regulator [Bacteroidales bacterium]|nr:sigma-54 dependent transcriptional regulator [Bacteroidales bacterium]
MNRKILIVEDDVTFGKMLESWLERNGFSVVLLSHVKDAKREILKQEFDLVLTDLRLPDEDGIMLLTWVKSQKAELPIMIMTSYAEISNAVSAIKLGALDYLEKPINPAILKEKIEQVWNTPQKPVKTTVRENKETTNIVQGNGKASQRMYQHILLVASTRMSVLILGESGTGKEYTARLIHEHSPRKNAPFIAVDCGSLSKELAPSELFGHLKGSFTSAIGDKKGVFEQAYGGTVFLDEIGNLPYEVQIQLLRTLQEQKVRPVGSAKDIKIDVRIVAATNEHLESAISQGRFREDLYHRLNEFIIDVPPLRERIEDMPIFVDYFLKEANRDLDKQITGISDEAMTLLKNHYWSGNLRELRNVIRRASLFAQTNEILPDNLPTLQVPSKIKDEATSLSLRSENEKEQIELALKKSDGNKTTAARLLKIDRKTLYNKMHQYGIKL